MSNGFASIGGFVAKSPVRLAMPCISLVVIVVFMLPVIQYFSDGTGVKFNNGFNELWFRDHVAIQEYEDLPGGPVGAEVAGAGQAETVTLLGDNRGGERGPGR